MCRLASGLAAALLFVAAACDQQPIEPKSTGLELPPPSEDVLAPIEQLSVGSYHVCVLGSDMRISCWGENANGQAVAPPGSFVSVGTGHEHSCGLRTDGSVECWGQNDQGQTDAPEGPFVEVSSGWSHNCGLREDGSVDCWGLDTSGQATDKDGPFIDVEAGRSSTCAIRADGTVACWGSPPTQPTGTFVSLSSASWQSCGIRTDGQVECWGSNPVQPPTTDPSVQVSVGYSHACSLSSTGSVTCWGSNGMGESTPPDGEFLHVGTGFGFSCGLSAGGGVECWGDNPAGRLTLLSGTFLQVAPGSLYACALRTTGELYCWGDNDYGRATPPSGEYTQLRASQFHACAVSVDASVQCWGHNAYGQSESRTGPFKAVTTGGFHTCAIRADDTVECWGADWDGLATPPDGTFQQISAGGVHTCGLRTNGTVACWGRIPGAASPDPPDPGAEFTQVEARSYHSCALSTNGSIVCWGQSATPPSGEGFTQLGLGGDQDCALDSEGKPHCWGNGALGQASPPPGSFQQIEGGAHQTCGVASDGFIECWGNPTTTTLVAGNTLPGAGVMVQPVDGTTGKSSPVHMTFDEVTGAGETTVDSYEVGQGGGPPPPRNFRLGAPPTSFDIQTGATFTGSVEVCIDYSGVSYGNENRLKLLHLDEATGSWVDVTTFLDTENDLVCGSVTGLSPFLVAEENVAPAVTALSLPSDPITVESPVGITASFVDENPGDAHTATIDWGDGQSAPGLITEPGLVSGSHSYAAPGVHIVTVTVSEQMDPGYDLSGERSSDAEATNSYVVVFDPSGGFVTGGGWIDSPEGAYPTDPTLAGKATFGFVSKYKKGTTVPTGSTEFHFKAGHLNFHSDVYEWLVVNQGGRRAQFKGSGAVNDVGGYRFQLWATDGETDAFRLRIWREAPDGTETDVYDNGSEQPIGGGSVVVHTAGT